MKSFMIAHAEFSKSHRAYTVLKTAHFFGLVG